jgi:hypothetical protein
MGVGMNEEIPMEMIKEQIFMKGIDNDKKELLCMFCNVDDIIFKERFKDAL